MFAGFVLCCHHYILYYSNPYYSIIYSGDSEAQTQQTQKLQNLTEKNENAAQKNARFHFFRSIFWKLKYMGHPYSILTNRKL